MVEIDSNHRLSRIVRNLASPNIVVIVLWNEMVRTKHEITTPVMVTIVCSLNDIPHVWHRIVANVDG